MILMSLQNHERAAPAVPNTRIETISRRSSCSSTYYY
jgi:hypothetical protein